MVKDKINSNPSSILFVSMDPHANDLDWKIPMILEYKKMGYDTTVILLYRSKMESKNFYCWILEKELIQVLYKEDLWFLDIFPERVFKALLSNKNLFIRLLSKVLFAEAPLIAKLFLFRYVRKYFVQKNITNYVADHEYVYLCQFPSLHRPLLIQLFQILSYQSKSKLIGVPEASHVELGENTYKYDLQLFNTELQGTQYERINKTPYIISGCQHFKKEWQNKLFQYYKEYKGSDSIVESSKTKVLVLLVKDDHLHWKGISFDKVVINLLSSLSSKDSLLLIKPHPRQDLENLKLLLAKISLENYEIVFDNVNYWASQANKIVALPSFSCLSVLAVGKVPYLYWPMDKDYKKFLTNGGNPQFIKSFFRLKNNEYCSIFGKYVIDVFDVSFQFKKVKKEIIQGKLRDFEKDYMLHKNTKDILKNIDDHFDNNANNDLSK